VAWQRRDGTLGASTTSTAARAGSGAEQLEQPNCDEPEISGDQLAIAFIREADGSLAT
jgi:hypothetical protein